MIVAVTPNYDVIRIFDADADKVTWQRQGDAMNLIFKKTIGLALTHTFIHCIEFPLETKIHYFDFTKEEDRRRYSACGFGEIKP